MQQVNWEVVPTQGGQVGVLGLRVQDAQSDGAPWQYYFTGISASEYPDVIEAATREEGSAGECTGVTFPSDMDEADVAERGPLAADAVEVYHHYMGSTVMPRATFYAVLLAFGERLAEQPGQPDTWYAALRAALDKLRAKMAADTKP